MKATPIDRLELTRRKMAFKEAMKHATDVPAYPGAEEHTEPQFYGEKCPFNSEKCSFHGEKCSFNDNICPFCGRNKLVHESGCVKCIACGWSKCG